MITILNSIGATESIESTKDNQDVSQFISTARRFELAVAMRQVPKFSSIDKYGYSSEVSAGALVWEGNAVYNYSTTADITHIVSDNAADTHDIVILGQDIDGVEIEQTVTLNGITPVALTTPLFRCYRAYSVGATPIVGQVRVSTDGAGYPAIADTRAIIIDGNNQTQQANYTIPAGYVGFLLRGELGVAFESGAAAGDEFMSLQYRSRRLGGSFTVKKTITLMTRGNSIYQDIRQVPDIVPGRTDIEITCASVSTTGMGAFGALDILLVEEDYFSDALLAAIGQPGY